MPAPNHHAGARAVIAEIERRRSFVRKPPDPSLTIELHRIERTLRDAACRESGAQAAWSRLAPPELAANVRVVALSGGTLTLDARTPASRYLADRWLRSRGRALLGQALGSGVLRVKFRSSPAMPPRSGLTPPPRL